MYVYVQTSNNRIQDYFLYIPVNAYNAYVAYFIYIPNPTSKQLEIFDWNAWGFKNISKLNAKTLVFYIKFWKI